MKNTLWRFGDSWSTTNDIDYFKIELNHSKYVADYFNLDYKNLGIGGYSNLQIFNDLIKNQNNFKKNDIVLINFASVSRIAIVEDFEISCVANGGSYDDVSKLMVDVIVNDMGKPISDILFYLIKSFIESLIDKGIRVYFFFLDEIIELNLKNGLIFESSMGNGFIHWCIENDYQDLSPKGNVHYKLGSQKDIANKIIELIEQNDNQEKRMGNQ
jgi:hypothetical protein